jgi:hypothetical protein
MSLVLFHMFTITALAIVVLLRYLMAFDGVFASHGLKQNVKKIDLDEIQQGILDCMLVIFSSILACVVAAIISWLTLVLQNMSRR